MNRESKLEDLRQAIYAAAELLPSQGPITAFAFLNPLQGMESLPFDEAMSRVKRIYGAEAYLEETRYFAKVQRGRITVEDLRTVIEEDLGSNAHQPIGGLCDRTELRLSLLANAIHCGVDRELDWLIAESQTLWRFRSDVSSSSKEAMIKTTMEWIGNSPADSHYALQSLGALQSNASRQTNWRSNQESTTLRLLWEIIRSEIGKVFKQELPLPEVRHRDLLRRTNNIDCDQWVHELLVRFCSAYLDQGQSNWRLPQRHLGFFQSFCAHHRQSMILTRRWQRGLAKELARIVDLGMSPLESIEESLNILGVNSSEREEYLQATLLALRGFAGMIWQTEIRPDRVKVPSPPGTLVEYVAIRLILDRLALTYGARQILREIGPLSELRKHLIAKLRPRPEVSEEQQSYVLFQMAQILGWPANQLASLKTSQWAELSEELNRFSSHQRRRLFHLAFERGTIHQSLNAISCRVQHPPISPSKPKLQVICCIDAREESIRRHLEEIDDEIETFGIAGFFGVPMYYRGAGDAQFASHAPIVVRPKHWVTEEVVYSFEDSHRNRAQARRLIGSTSRRLHASSRGSIVGAIVTTLIGPLATAPLLSRVLFPRLTGSLHRTARQFVAPPSVTRLHLERNANSIPGESDEGLGFTVAEMAKFSEQALRDIGLLESFARLVILMGHGTSCLNNPHESSYHCGACSGSPGGPNARALAAMLNDLRVRRILHENGIEIPEDTFFLGALHNTATEEIRFYDLELLPSSQIAGLKWAREKFSLATQRDAQERCRRFESASLGISLNDALLHVQARTEDLAQTRPEYGNSTNALCFVGRRRRIRGLYLDRRSFLMSYDPSRDDAQTNVLKRILGAVIPVCQGINSLYSFSAIDSASWGAGTKLPHNVTSLLGVMDGAASDLRTGVPWQGIDIHEPVRLQFIIETRPEQLLAIIQGNEVLSKIFRNQWAHFATLDPDSTQVHCYVNGQFVPYDSTQASLPTALSSLEWFKGKRDHLPFARILKSQ